MKEFYTSPEAELLRFAPAENLATGDVPGSLGDDEDYDGKQD